jgi:hypothetical protein
VIRTVAAWTAGRLLQLQWSYRLWEDDGTYHLEAKLEWQTDDHYAPAFGHKEAHKIAEELEARDRAWLEAEEQAHAEDEANRNLLQMRRTQ